MKKWRLNEHASDDMTYTGSSGHDTADDASSRVSAAPDERANAMLAAARGGERVRLRLSDILRMPMPDQPSWRGRTAIRTFAALGRRQVRAIYGIENLDPRHDPFILALSHNIHREAVMVPGLLMLLRGGRHIHFLADWGLLLFPVLGWLVRHAGAIIVTNKRAGALTFMRPLFENPLSSADQMRVALEEGRSVGVFPEGTVTRDPNQLLYGRAGTARLSLETGVPVVPAGIRFPDAPRDRPLDEREPMEVHIGTAMTPPPIAGDKPSLSEGRAWHATIMREIARLSDKEWQPTAKRDRDRGKRSKDGRRSA